MFIVIFTSIFTITQAVVYTNKLNQDINCTNNATCAVECSQKRACALSSIHCNNATKCNIICDAHESCLSATIYHTPFNKELVINCMNFESCKYVNIQHEETMDFTVSTNKSLTLNSLSRLASASMTLSQITTFSDININCAEESSCDSMLIQINTNNISYMHFQTVNRLYFTMNIYCSGVASCAHMKLAVFDVNDTDRYVEWEDFAVSLHCNNSQSCQYAFIDAARLKINSLLTSESFGDFYLFCAHADEACLFMHVLCPDLVAFYAIYDYLYQTKKCHISFIESYQNSISIISKHGAKMIDITCDENDDLMCAGITLHCSHDPNSYYCSMQYNSSNHNWYCNNHHIYYTFAQNYSYGCDDFIWLDDIAIIETSKIPNYNNKSTLSCAKYNPSITLHDCFMFCDSDYSCAKDIRCDTSTKCHIECAGLQSCKDSITLHNNIYCPYFIEHSTCSLIINPTMLQSEFGGWYSIYFVHVYSTTSLDLTISHNVGSYVHDYGMMSANITILNSDNLTGWTPKYDVESWYRVLNLAHANVTTPLSINILCDRCYTDWVDIVQYDFNRNVSVHLTCIYCSGSLFDGYGIRSFTFDCVENCSYASIGFTDSDANINCHNMASCNGMNIYLVPSNYSSYIDDKYEYHLNLLHESLHINVFSLYGFNQMVINYLDNNTEIEYYQMDFYCGYPDYYMMFDNYDEADCLQSNPLYTSSVVGLFEWQYAAQNISSETLYCTVYKSCQNSAIHCTGTDCIIHCDGVFSCQYSRIYTNYYIGAEKYTQNSVKVYCMAYNACDDLIIYGNDADDIELHCTAGDSCHQLTVHHEHALNPSKGLTVICYDKYKYAQVLPADFIYHWASCSSMFIHCPSIGCNLNLQASTYADHYNINLFYAQGLNELNISCAFNTLTNRSTCYDVHYYCKLMNNGSYLYYSQFDEKTGACLGECCGYIFSDSPTFSPSNAPSNAPTIAPTNAPTYSPSASPTRYPTKFEFDAYFVSLFYIMINDNHHDIYNVSSAVILDVTASIEYGFLSASTGWSYSEYMVTIKNISYDGLKQFNLTTKVSSDSDVISHYAAFSEVNQEFYETVSEQLEMKWNVTNVTFGVYADSILIYKPETMNTADSNLTFVGFIVFTICVWIIALLSFLHTKHKLKCLDKIPNIKPCDDEQFMNVIKFGMQALDLYSDIAFCWELYVFAETLDNDNDITVITVLYSLSFIFFMLPFLINLILAVIFERFIGKKSIFTLIWFHKYSKLFAILVIVSGSVSASLQLINSSIFGLVFFHAAFSKYNLLQMNKFRILCTVLIENFPQFCIQLVYVSYFSDRENVVTFTFVVSTSLSLLSILSSIMAYFLQKHNVAQFQTIFNVEIILTDDKSVDAADRIQRNLNLELDDSSSFKIDVLDKNVKRLHKKCNLRKILKESIAKCMGKLSDNFELLYCIEHIDGLTFNGLCTSDDYNILNELFAKYENELTKLITKIYQLDVSKDQFINQEWKIKFVVFDDTGKAVGFTNDERTDLLHSNEDHNKNIQLTTVEQ